MLLSLLIQIRRYSIWVLDFEWSDECIDFIVCLVFCVYDKFSIKCFDSQMEIVLETNKYLDDFRAIYNHNKFSNFSVFFKYINID